MTGTVIAICIIIGYAIGVLTMSLMFMARDN